MKTIAALTLIAAAACLMGCEAITIEKSAEPSKQQISLDTPMVDPYEPDGGGRNMTPSLPQYDYFHTIYPAGDVDFRYMQSVGAYTLEVQPSRAAVRVRVWTRAQKLHGPSRLVTDQIAGAGQPLRIPVTLTNDQSFAVVRVEAAPGAGWTAYGIRFVPRVR